MKVLLTSIALGLAALVLTACGGMRSTVSPTTQPAPLVPTANISEPTSVAAATSGPPAPAPSTSETTVAPTVPPAPRLPAPGTSEPASETFRLDLASGVVVVFVEGLTPEMSEKVAYVTHVPSGAQAVLDLDRKVIDRHDGREDGPSRLDAILNDEAAMARITEGLTNGEDARPRPHTITWVPMVKFGGVDYLKRWSLVGQVTREDHRDLTAEALGPELYRVAFRGSGYVGPFYRYQDGDATYLNPGTQVYSVKGYSPQFRLATLEEGKATLYEADTNPFAKTGGDLLDIRGKVKAVDVLNDDDAMTILGTIDDEQTIERFVEMVLEAPVHQRNRDHDGPRYFPRHPAR